MSVFLYRIFFNRTGLDNEPIRPHGRPHGRRTIRRWVVPVLALSIALGAQGGLTLFGEEGSGPRAYASSPTAALMPNDDGRDDDDGDHDEHDDDEEPRTEWEGEISAFPATLTGTWSIVIETGTTISLTADASTHFKNPQGRDFVVGRWVEVEGIELPNGSVVATRIRLDEYEESEIIVRLVEDSMSYSATLASKYDLQLEEDLLRSANILLYSTTDEDEDEVVEEIKADEKVQWAELNYVHSAPEGDGYRTWGWGGKSEPAAYSNQDAFLQVRLGYAARQFDGQGITVAVMDTGVYTPHDGLAGRLQLPSLDVVDEDSDPSEEGPGLALGHGTHVAGIAAAIAPEATLLPVRVLDENGRGNTFLLAYAIEWAVDQGADVINLSLGTPYDSEILRDVIAATVEQGVIVAAAAGNGDTDQIQYPAGYAGVLAVTAVDGDNRKASFANYGEGWIDMAAPGVDIMSTVITEEGPGYATWSGTSMSTAFVSGGAALVEQKGDLSATAASPVTSHMVSSGIAIDADNPEYAEELGRLLNVSGALGVAAPIPSTVYMPQVLR